MNVKARLLSGLEKQRGQQGDTADQVFKPISGNRSSRQFFSVFLHNPDKGQRLFPSILFGFAELQSKGKISAYFYALIESLNGYRISVVAGQVAGSCDKVAVMLAWIELLERPGRIGH